MAFVFAQLLQHIILSGSAALKPQMIFPRIILKLFPTRVYTLNKNIDRNRRFRRKIYITKWSSKNFAHGSRKKGEQYQLTPTYEKRSWSVGKHVFERFSDVRQCSSGYFSKFFQKSWAEDHLKIYIFLLRFLFFPIFWFKLSKRVGKALI